MAPLSLVLTVSRAFALQPESAFDGFQAQGEQSELPVTVEARKLEDDYAEKKENQHRLFWSLLYGTQVMVVATTVSVGTCCNPYRGLKIRTTTGIVVDPGSSCHFSGGFEPFMGAWCRGLLKTWADAQINPHKLTCLQD